MINPVILDPALKRRIVKFCPSIGLQTVGFTTLFKNLVKGFDQGHPGFGFQGLHPRILGQHVQKHQQIMDTSIIFGQGLDFHQGLCNVKVYATYTPNPVPTRVELVSLESYEHGQNVAHHLNCLWLWDHGNRRATALRGMLSFFLSF